MRSFVLSLVICTSLSAQDNLDNQRSRAIRLWIHLDQFTRKICGCPVSGEFAYQQCRLRQGQLDYREYHAAREEAKKLFALHD